MFLKNKKNKKGGKKGFTLIEILLVMGIIAILATVVLVAVNPARQFAQARDTQRIANINTLLNAIGERIADHKGLFDEGCSAGAIPTTTARTMASTQYSIYDCLVPTYISSLPIDPKIGRFTTVTEYDTGYSVLQDSATGRITVTAPAGEINQSINVSR